MSDGLINFSTLRNLFFTGLASAIVGYLLRRLEIFENKKDELRAKTLPSIFAATTLFFKSIKLFKEAQLSPDDLVKKIQDVEKSLKKQVFEDGGVVYLKESRKNNIYNFYFHLSMVSPTLKGIDRDGLYSIFFEEGQKLGGISTSKFLELAEKVRLDVLNEIKEYEYRLPLIMIILLGLLGAISAILAFLEK